MKTIDTIISIGAMFYRVNREVLIGRKRDHRTVKIRNSVIGICRSEGHTLHSIGQALGERDHGSIGNSLKNLTPQNMGEMWRRHEFFEDVVKSSKDDHAITDCVEAMIGEIDAKIEGLQKMREMAVRMLSVSRVQDEAWNQKL